MANELSDKMQSNIFVYLNINVKFGDM